MVSLLEGPRVCDRHIPGHAVGERLFTFAAFPRLHHCGALTVDILQGALQLKREAGNRRDCDSTDIISAVCFKHTIAYHHEVELTVGRADGLKHKGYLAKLVIVQSRKRGWYPATEAEN